MKNTNYSLWDLSGKAEVKISCAIVNRKQREDRDKDICIFHLKWDIKNSELSSWTHPTDRFHCYRFNMNMTVHCGTKTQQDYFNLLLSSSHFTELVQKQDLHGEVLCVALYADKNLLPAQVGEWYQHRRFLFFQNKSRTHLSKVTKQSKLKTTRRWNIWADLTWMASLNF